MFSAAFCTLAAAMPAAAISDWISPAATVLERILCGAPKRAITCAKRNQARLGGGIMGGARAAILAATEPIWMMEPPPASFSSGRKVCATRKGPLRLVSSTKSQSASLDLVEIGGLVDAGIVDQDGNRPEGAAPGAPPVRHAARSVTSIGTARARRPMASILCDDGFGFGMLFAIGEKHIGAGLGQAQRDGARPARGCRR